MSSGGTNTTVSNNAPPAQFLNAYSNVVNAAGQVASTPYTPYSGNTVAPLSPDQTAGITGVENAQGAAAPYLNAAAQNIDAATAPIWNQVQQFNPSTVSEYESPYTSQVVNATENQLNNQNAIQQQQVEGNAISSGAWGGDRSAVAQGITAGQQALNEAPTIANLENTGYTNALGEFNTQQGSQLGATEANAWLNSQAGAANAALGQEALGTQLTGANALLGTGALEQQQAQAGLNVPYEQYIAQQAAPFQQTGWLANIAEGLGGASGGTSSTTSPAASVGSQIAGGALAGAGILGQTGAFGTSANPGWLTSAFGGGGSAAGVDAGTFASNYVASGGAITRPHDIGHHASGGGISLPGAVPLLNTPNLSITDIPDMPASHGAMDILKNYGTTSTTSGGTSELGQLIGLGGQVAAGIWGGPAASVAAGAFNQGIGLDHGGIVPFPIHKTRPPTFGSGIISNDNWHPPGPFRAVGGIIPHFAVGGLPSATSLSPAQSNAINTTGLPADQSSPFYTPSADTTIGVTTIPSKHGGPAVPQMTVGTPGPIARAVPPGNTALSNYFGSVAAGRSFAPPPGLPTLNFNNLTSTPGAASSSATPATPSNWAQYITTSDYNNSLGGSGANGGAVPLHRDDGGDVPDNGILPGLAVSQAIQKIEGHGTSPQGAVDGIMPATFAQYAEPGEKFTDPIARSMVRERIIGDLANRSDVQGDPARIGVGFFSGPGNIAPLGSATPYLRNRSDALGTTAADYANRVAGAVPGGGIAPDQQDFFTASQPAGGITDTGEPPAHGHSIWNTLTNVGLGIMGGTSPQAGVNIGRGALQGIQVSDKEAQQAMARDQQKSNNMFKQATMELEQAKLRNTTQNDQATQKYRQDSLAQQGQLHQDLLDQGKYTASPVTMPDPDDPTKTISGVNRFNTKTGDVEFVPTNTNPNRAGAAGTGLGGRESVYLNRVTQAGNAATAALGNIMELPTTASTGIFGGRTQGPGLLAAGKEALTNTLTTQGVQDYNTMIAGVARNLATLESAGLAPGGAFTGSMNSIMLKEGDTEATKMRKLAEARQIIEKNLEPNLSNPRIPPQQRDMIQGIITNVQKAVPFTQHDITAFQASPAQTMTDFAKSSGLGSSGSAAPASSHPASAIPSWVKPGDQYSPTAGMARDASGKLYGPP